VFTLELDEHGDLVLTHKLVSKTDDYHSLQSASVIMTFTPEEFVALKDLLSKVELSLDTAPSKWEFGPHTLPDFSNVVKEFDKTRQSTSRSKILASTFKETALFTVALCCCVIGEMAFGWVSSISPITAPVTCIVAGVFFGVLSHRSRVLLQLIVFLDALSDSVFYYARTSSMSPLLINLFKAMGESSAGSGVPSDPVMITSVISVVIGLASIGICIVILVSLIIKIIRERRYLYYLGGFMLPQFVLFVVFFVSLIFYGLNPLNMHDAIAAGDYRIVSAAVNSIVIYMLSLSVIAPYYIFWFLRSFKFYDKIPQSIRC